MCFSVLFAGGGKHEHLTTEEVVNCSCKRSEEDGLMIQCDICLCWQHGTCLGVEEEDQVCISLKVLTLHNFSSKVARKLKVFTSNRRCRYQAWCLSLWPLGVALSLPSKCWSFFDTPSVGKQAGYSRTKVENIHKIDHRWRYCLSCLCLFVFRSIDRDGLNRFQFFFSCGIFGTKS